MQEKSLDKLKNCKICIQHLNNKHARSAKWSIPEPTQAQIGLQFIIFVVLMAKL